MEIEFLKGRESVWRELYEKSLKEIEREKEITSQAIEQLQPQKDNEELIEQLKSDKQFLMSQRNDQERHKDISQKHLSCLLTDCMTINNLSADQRLAYIRREYKELYNGIIKQP